MNGRLCRSSLDIQKLKEIGLDIVPLVDTQPYR